MNVKRPDGSTVYLEDPSLQEELKKIFNQNGWYQFIERRSENYLFQTVDGSIDWLLVPEDIGSLTFSLKMNFGGKKMNRKEIESFAKMKEFW